MLRLPANGGNGLDTQTRLLTVGQVAERLGVSPQTVRRWADQGFIPVARTPGRQRRFDAGQVDAFAATVTPNPLLVGPEPEAEEEATE